MTLTLTGPSMPLQAQALEEGMVMPEVDEFDTVTVFDGGTQPEPGESRHWFGVRSTNNPLNPTKSSAYGYDLPVDEDTPLYLQIGGASSSQIDEAHGDLMGRSNIDRLMEDFPTEVIHVHGGGYGSEFLVVRIDRPISKSLFDAIAGLREYPIYDESHWSDLEAEHLREWADRVIDVACDRIEDEREDLDPDVIRADAEDHMTQYLDAFCISRAEELGEDAFLDDFRKNITGNYPTEGN